eukprot:5983192-Pleurochrysis_carterae.AAC.1
MQTVRFTHRRASACTAQSPLTALNEYPPFNRANNKWEEVSAHSIAPGDIRRLETFSAWRHSAPGDIRRLETFGAWRHSAARRSCELFARQWWLPMRVTKRLATGGCELSGVGWRRRPNFKPG